MKQNPRRIFMPGVWVAFAMLLLGTLACGVSSGDGGAGLELTRQVQDLQSTQLAMQQVTASQPQQPTSLPSEPPPPPRPVLPTKGALQPAQDAKKVPQKTELPQPAALVGSYNLTIVNGSASQIICYLYVASSESDNWGKDLLGTDNTLMPGGSTSIKLPGGTYDISVDDCDSINLAEEYGLKINKGTTWTFKGGQPVCGDNICSTDEQCAEDCGSGGLGTWCGDDLCAQDETANNCPADCGGDTGICGDSVCGDFENSCNCPGDCGSPCGDGVCSDMCGEDANTCPLDCNNPMVCGDGVCDTDEQCAEDCGSGGLGTWCGDDICAQDETADNCPADCGGDTGICGDGVCGNYEDSCNCPDDCGSPCGDGVCSEMCGEDATTCPFDCQ